MAKLNSKDIAEEFAASMGIPKSVAKAYMDWLIGSVRSHVEQGDEVTLNMFGRFRLAVTAPRKGRDMRSGAPCDIPAKTRIKFDMSRTLAAQYDGCGGPDLSSLVSDDETGGEGSDVT